MGSRHPNIGHLLPDFTLQRVSIARDENEIAARGYRRHQSRWGACYRCRHDVLLDLAMIRRPASDALQGKTMFVAWFSPAAARVGRRGLHRDSPPRLPGSLTSSSPATALTPYTRLAAFSAAWLSPAHAMTGWSPGGRS